MTLQLLCLNTLPFHAIGSLLRLATEKPAGLRGCSPGRESNKITVTTDEVTSDHDFDRIYHLVMTNIAIENP
jgi:hypothetical protein